MFKSTHNKGFQITLPNGYSISCQFGSTNYCSRRTSLFSQDVFILPLSEEMKNPINESPDCEVTIWRGDSRIYVTDKIMEAVGINPSEYGTASFQAYVTAYEFATIVAYLKDLD